MTVSSWHTPPHNCEKVSTEAQVYGDLGLVINADKTEVMYQWYEAPSENPVLHVEN